VLNPLPRKIEDPEAGLGSLHYRVNFPVQFATDMADRYRFLSLLETVAEDQHLWQEEGAQLVLNNMVNEYEMSVPATQEMVRALVRRIGLPVINEPEAVFRVSRERNVETLSGVPGLKMPRFKLYRHELGGTREGGTGERGTEAAIARIGPEIGYPAILRPLASHASAITLVTEGPKSAYLVATAAEARDALAEAGWSGFSATEYVDLRKKNGWFRKLRGMFVGTEIVIGSGGYWTGWNVAGWRSRKPGQDFYRAHPETFAKIRAIVGDPEGELGRPCLDTLEQIRQRIGLDVFGIDFDVDDEGAGEVVFFEATPGMTFPHPTKKATPNLHYPVEPYERMLDAFHALVARKIAEGPGGSS